MSGASKDRHAEVVSLQTVYRCADHPSRRRSRAASRTRGRARGLPSWGMAMEWTRTKPSQAKPSMLGRREDHPRTHPFLLNGSSSSSPSSPCLPFPPLSLPPLSPCTGLSPPSFDPTACPAPLCPAPPLALTRSRGAGDTHDPRTPSRAASSLGGARARWDGMGWDVQCSAVQRIQRATKGSSSAAKAVE